MCVSFQLLCEVTHTHNGCGEVSCIGGGGARAVKGEAAPTLAPRRRAGASLVPRSWWPRAYNPRWSAGREKRTIERARVYNDLATSGRAGPRSRWLRGLLAGYVRSACGAGGPSSCPLWCLGCSMVVLARCFRCKARTEVVDAEPLVRPRRALQLRGRCSRCLGPVARFVPAGFDVRSVPRSAELGAPHW